MRGELTEEQMRERVRKIDPVGKGVYRIYAASGEFLLLAQVTDGTAVTIKSFFEVS